MNETGRRSWRRTSAVLALTLAVLGGATLAAWLAEAGPFRGPSHCWGAWQEGSGPEVLGDDYARVVKETGSPERGGQATCAMVFGPPGTEEMRHADAALNGEAPADSAGQRLIARVGPPPRSTGEPRRAWLAEALHGSAAPLPGGVPGVVGRDRGTLVLPEECDGESGLPMVVTVRSEGMEGMEQDIGSEQDVADLLFSLADTARERAGCAGGDPIRITEPVRVAHGESAAGRAPSCGISGMRFAPRDGTLRDGASAVGERFQSCSLTLSREDEGREEAVAGGQFAMTSHPRLAPLFAGMAGGTSPGSGWRGEGRTDGRGGVVTAECRGRPTVFYLDLDEELAEAAEPGARRVFARSVNSVAERLGCAAVGPRE